MPTPNIVDLSYYQTKSQNGSMDIDFADLKTNGIKAVIIRLGHGTTRDSAAEGFVKQAKAAGLVVHGYHFYEQDAKDQVQFSIDNAKAIGLDSNAYYFLDMEGDITGSWPDIFRAFYRNWQQAGWKVGLYASLSKYGLFDLNELKLNNVYKWVAAWGNTQPGVADVWQYDCSVGLGKYTLQLDKDVDLTGKLVQPITEPTPLATDPNGQFQVKAGAFVNFDYSTTSIQGGKMLVASPDGINKIPKLGPDGAFIFINKDFDNIWAGIKDRIKLPSVSDKIQWTNIINVPDLATQDDLKKIELTPGPQGNPGTPGKDGQPGKDGKSAYQIAVDNGFVGSEAEWLQSLHGKDGATTSDGDASLSIEAITDLIKQHIHALVDTNNGQLTISTDDVSNGSIADAVATKVVSSMSWKMDANGELIAEVGGE